MFRQLRDRDKLRDLFFVLHLLRFEQLNDFVLVLVLQGCGRERPFQILACGFFLALSQDLVLVQKLLGHKLQSIVFGVGGGLVCLGFQLILLPVYSLLESL